MTPDAQTPTADEPTTIYTDLELELLDVLERLDTELEIGIDEYETQCNRKGEQPSGKAPIGLTYADAREMRAIASAIETRARHLGQRYREDLADARQEAARRAQEPFSGRERSMLRVAIGAYGEALTKEAKRLQDMSRDAEARTILGDAATLLERVQPLFSEQLPLGADVGPLFGGADAGGRVTDGTLTLTEQGATEASA